MIAAIDASGWGVIIGAVFLGLTQLTTLLLAYRRDAVKAAQVAIVAVKAEEVARTADKKLDSIHTLVNSSMGRQLQMSAILSRRIALLTNKPEDKLAADEAEKLLKEHDEKQSSVDSKTDAFPSP